MRRRRREAEEARLQCMMAWFEAEVAFEERVHMGGSHAIEHSLATVGVGTGRRRTSWCDAPAGWKYNYAQGDEKVRGLQRPCWIAFGADETILWCFLSKRGFAEGDGGCGMWFEVVSELGMPRL